MEIAGYKVLRWEREWDEPGRPFRDPGAYPACAVATTGTHDTETLAEWWDAAPIDERRALAAVASLRDTSLDADAPFSGRARDTILAALIASSADLVLLPIQDVFGWRDRINTPAVVNERNWTWRVPWPVDDLDRQPLARERAAFLRAQVQRCTRMPE
jgi:4-alpha-glucanotransferase